MKHHTELPQVHVLPLSSHHQAYLEMLYALYLEDPQQLDPTWCCYFTTLEQQPSCLVDPPSCPPSFALHSLIDAFRTHGHRQAQLDPLGLTPPPHIPELQLAFHGFQPQDPSRYFTIAHLGFACAEMPLSTIYARLKKIYCGPLGVEYRHLDNLDEQRWIEQRLEIHEGIPSPMLQTQLWLLEQLVAADGLERYLAVKFPGAKRFSLEGGDTLIPLLNTLLSEARVQGVEEVVLGMAHRGRLNVLVNVLGKPIREVCAAFAKEALPSIGSGDVKYHQGYINCLQTSAGELRAELLFNPSHLEIVNPVVMGYVRARQEQHAERHREQVLPITIHGDAAFIGQGVVQETFNLSQLPGYHVGGTVRIVVNNQLGFTTSPGDARSTSYCTDIAKIVAAPIFHVNGDDPEAVFFVAQLALDYRRTFARDVVIDLVCYRRQGHNEADEPAATQPILYQCIRAHAPPYQKYRDRLVAAGRVTAEETAQRVTAYRARLEQGECLLASQPLSDSCPTVDASSATAQDTVDQDRLILLGRQMCHYPDGYPVHNRVEKIYHDRHQMVTGSRPLDWGAAETLAYATVLAQGSAIRLAGQDSGRGTFFHRHAVLYHQTQAHRYIPLMHLQQQQGHFSVWDSPLSEAAVLAFEYGYCLANSNGLVIWEAQFGDFSNGAQVVIDQFISSAEQKWGQTCGIVLFLPHGYEGQGPEHSSARLERFLQLCAEDNLQICVPTTPAQIYHLLRRQALHGYQKPLIVFTPKSLLRHPLATSSLEDLATGTFHPLLLGQDGPAPEQVQKVVFCSGKIYYDLLMQQRESKVDSTLLLRIEQLYPFPQAELQNILTQFPRLESCVWCQEEPMNQGGWSWVQPHLQRMVDTQITLQFAGRPAASAPATGYLALHQQQQQTLVQRALGLQAVCHLVAKKPVATAY